MCLPSVPVSDEILGGFELFGKVESVEIINDKPSPHIALDGHKTDVTHEAYVTFADSYDAFKAIKSEMLPKNIIDLLPADTWHQPDYKSDTNNSAKWVIKCDHKCAKRSQEPDLSREFSDLSIQADEMLCEHSVTAFDLNLELGTKLGSIRNTLLKIRPYVGHLSMNVYYGFDNDALEDAIDRGSFHRRVMEIIGTLGAGPKLQEMTIDGSGITSEMLKCLAPILKQIEVLTIGSSCANVLYLLPKFCPNVHRFCLLTQNWKGDGADMVVEQWPSLNSFMLRSLELDVDNVTESGRKFRRFLALNTQIETLEIEVIADNSLLKLIGKSMRNLTELTVNRISFDGVGGMIDQMVRMKHLNSILIPTFILKTCHFKSLVSLVECCSKMKRLKMTTLLQHYTLDEDLHTGEFPIKFHNNCNCHGPNSRALTFYDNADSVDLPKDKAVLALMVSVSRGLKIKDNTLESRINTMFKQTKKFYPNVLKASIIEMTEASVYTHIAY